MKNIVSLMIVDMQKYYLDKNSDFYKLATYFDNYAMNYIYDRCFNVTIQNIKKLKELFAQKKLPIIYLKLSSKRKDKKDLHRIFYKYNLLGKNFGFMDVYPNINHKMADIIDEIKPDYKDIVINKTTFSGFSSTNLEKVLKRKNIKIIVFTGLATSQCVETTARDASDRGFHTIFIEDCLADYSEFSHITSLINSKAICGGWVYSTENFINNFDNIIQEVFKNVENYESNIFELLKFLNKK